MAALGGFRGQTTGRGQLAGGVCAVPMNTTRARTVWVEAVEARRKWHDLAVSTGNVSMETWEPYDPAWRTRIRDLHADLQESLIGGELDPRATCIDLMAAVGALVERMGDAPAPS